MSGVDHDLLSILHLTEEDLKFLQSQGYGPDRLRRIGEILHEKLFDVRAELFITNSTPRLGEVLHRGQKLIPSVPNDLGFEFFLSNRVRIAQDGDTAKKEDQPLRITRAIFHWRLDKFHQFQRYHDPLKWNMAIYLALLVDDKAERDPNNLNYDNSRTRIRLNDTNKRYMIDFLRCFLEHHNTPAQFGIRESFITNWKDTKLDIFIVRGKLRGRVKDAYKRLTGDWETLLENRRSMVAPAAFEARFGKFVGVLIPGDQAYKTQRNHSNMEFQAVTTLSENTRAPRQEKWTTLLAAMETPFDTNMIADVEPQEGPRHVCQLEAAAKALESVQVQEILELLDADFA